MWVKGAPGLMATELQIRSLPIFQIATPSVIRISIFVVHSISWLAVCVQVAWVPLYVPMYKSTTSAFFRVADLARGFSCWCLNLMEIPPILTNGTCPVGQLIIMDLKQGLISVHNVSLHVVYNIAYMQHPITCYGVLKHATASGNKTVIKSMTMTG